MNLFVWIENLIAPGFISFRYKSLGLFLSYTRELGQFVFRIKACFVGNLFIQQQEKVQYILTRNLISKVQLCVLLIYKCHFNLDASAVELLCARYI